MHTINPWRFTYSPIPYSKLNNNKIANRMQKGLLWITCWNLGHTPMVIAFSQDCTTFAQGTCDWPRLGDMIRWNPSVVYNTWNTVLISQVSDHPHWNPHDRHYVDNSQSTPPKYVRKIITMWYSEQKQLPTLFMSTFFSCGLFPGDDFEDLINQINGFQYPHETLVETVRTVDQHHLQSIPWHCVLVSGCPTPPCASRTLCSLAPPLAPANTITTPRQNELLKFKSVELSQDLPTETGLTTE